MRLWGAEDFGKLVYRAKRFMMPIAKIWNGNVQMMNSWLCTSNMKLSMNWKKNFGKEEGITAMVASYVDEHLELFAKIV